MDNNNHPLVSVFVVSYNAGEYICETLDSIKAQTYGNIELIVSDDHSSDDTVCKAKEWIEKNKERFVRTEVITVDHNTGVSANYNRAVKACRGEWVKNIDGDDLITPNCIEDNLEYVRKHPDCKWVFSQVQNFRSDNNRIEYLDYIFNDKKKEFFSLGCEEQFKYLLKENLLPSQSNFIHIDLLKSHPYNEDYRGLEDAPLWLNLAKDGYKACYFDVCTALYRSNESITSSSERFYSSLYFESSQKFFWSEKVNHIRRYNLIDAYNHNRRYLLTMEFADVILGNKKSRVRNMIFRIARRYINKHVYFKL